MVARVFRRLPLIGAVAALLLAGWASLVPAQDKQQIGSESVEGTFNLPANKARFAELVSGKAKPDAKDKTLLQNGARYQVVRLTWPTVIKEKPPLDGGGATGVRNAFDKMMTDLAGSSVDNKEFLKQFAHELVVAFKEMLVLDVRNYHYAVTNTALMLPSLAKCRQDEVHDFLLELVKPDKDKNYTALPFIRMCAVRALGEFNNPHWAKVEGDPD